MAYSQEQRIVRGNTVMCTVLHVAFVFLKRLLRRSHKPRMLNVDVSATGGVQKEKTALYITSENLYGPQGGRTK